MKKICYVASSGGHLTEILGLKGLEAVYDSILVTEKTSYKPHFWQKRMYTVPAVDRNNKFLCLIKLCVISCMSLFIFLKEKPDIILTTGTLMACPICLLAKMTGKKLIYIESIARVYSGSAMGLWAYKYADLFLIQWESLRDIFPKAIYTGRLI